MAWSRANAATWVANTLGALLADAGIGTADDAGALGDPIDEALLLIGTPPADLTTATVPDAERYGFQRVLRWRVLVRVRDAVANRVDISMADPSISKSRNQIVANLNGLVDAAAADAEPYLSGDVAASAWGVGSLNLDFIEPETVS